MLYIYILLYILHKINIIMYNTYINVGIRKKAYFNSPYINITKCNKKEDSSSILNHVI